MRKLTSLLTSVALVVLPIFAALPATDSFTGSDGTTLNTHNACWRGQASGAEINGNAVRSVGGEYVAVWSAGCDSVGDDQYSQVVVDLQTNSYVGAVIRSTGGGGADEYQCTTDATTLLLLRKKLGGGSVNLQIVGPATTGQTLKIQASGTTISCLLDGVVVASAIDTDIASGQPGVFVHGSGTLSKLDSWEAGIVGAGPPPSSAARRRVIN